MDNLSLKNIERLFSKKLNLFRGEIKEDIVESEHRILERIDIAEVRLFNVVNDTKVNRTELQQLEKRVSKLEYIILD